VCPPDAGGAPLLGFSWRPIMDEGKQELRRAAEQGTSPLSIATRIVSADPIDQTLSLSSC
jgi:hypothetical protein